MLGGRDGRRPAVCCTRRRRRFIRSTAIFRLVRTHSAPSPLRARDIQTRLFKHLDGGGGGAGRGFPAGSRLLAPLWRPHLPLETRQVISRSTLETIRNKLTPLHPTSHRVAAASLPLPRSLSVCLLLSDRRTIARAALRCTARRCIALRPRRLRHRHRCPAVAYTGRRAAVQL